MASSNEPIDPRLLDWFKRHPYGDQDENGIDLSLLRANLALTPQERLAKLQQLVRTVPRGAHAVS